MKVKNEFRRERVGKDFFQILYDVPTQRFNPGHTDIGVRDVDDLRKTP